jgi:uncharacterized protein YegL
MIIKAGKHLKEESKKAMEMDRLNKGLVCVSSNGSIAAYVISKSSSDSISISKISKKREKFEKLNSEETNEFLKKVVAATFVNHSKDSVFQLVTDISKKELPTVSDFVRKTKELTNNIENQLNIISNGSKTNKYKR